jgi:transposase
MLDRIRRRRLAQNGTLRVVYALNRRSQRNLGSRARYLSDEAVMIFFALLRRCGTLRSAISTMRMRCPHIRLPYTIAWRVAHTVLRSRAAVLRPVLTANERRVRLEHATRCLKEPRLHFNTVYSDECMVVLRGSSAARRRVWVGRRGDGAAFVHHFGRSALQVMVFACIHPFFGCSELAIFDGSISSLEYEHVVGNYVRPYLTNAGAAGARLRFMQDNAPSHTAVYASMELQGLDLVDWPPHSPDMNPIEDLWARLKALLVPYAEHIVTVEDLRRAVNAVWKRIASDRAYIGGLYEKIYKRFSRIVAINGANSCM